MPPPEWISTHWLEIFGALTGIIYVLLEIRQNIVFFTSKFYADMSLQVYYLAISFYGWYAWRHGTKSPTPLASEPAKSNTASPGVSPAQTKAPDAASHGITAPHTLAPEAPINTAPVGAHASHPDTIQTSLSVTRTSLRLAMKLAAVYLVLHAAMWYILAFYTDSTVAGWDSFTTALSVVATWMLARKYIEHWILWIVINIISMILYIYKGLYPTTALFIVYTLMAFVGYREWKRHLTGRTDEPDAKPDVA
jgi:nicotinamide mononucleotide transporter